MENTSYGSNNGSNIYRKNHNMSIYIEILVLYFLLFFTGSAAGWALHIAIILYIFARNWKSESRILKPGKKDLITCLVSLPLLLIIGAITGIISMFFVPTTQVMPISPSDISGWIFLSFTSFLLAYLEESFFRFYLLTKIKEMGLSAKSALLFSITLFSFCHIYLGPFGFLNSVIAGLILGLLFLKFGSLHGIAIAHGFYNIIAFVINALS